MTTTNDVGSTSDYVKSLQTVAPPTNQNPTGTSTLGKDAFLQLLVTQMKNQDPLSPQDNTAFVAQLAQFSSVEQLQNLNTSVGAITSNYQSSQALQASSLVGRNVIVNAGSAVVDTTKGLNGQVVVPASNSDTTIKVYDTSANLVSTIDLGAQKAGTSDFTWDGKQADGTAAPAGTYSFVATASGSTTPLVTYLPATVNSVTMGANGGAMKLNLAGGASVALTDVQQIGI